jgi:hypothetical protein
MPKLELTIPADSLSEDACRSSMPTPDGVAEPHAVIEISVPDGALSARRQA